MRFEFRKVDDHIRFTNGLVNFQLFKCSPSPFRRKNRSVKLHKRAFHLIGHCLDTRLLSRPRQTSDRRTISNGRDPPASRTIRIIPLTIEGGWSQPFQDSFRKGGWASEGHDCPSLQKPESPRLGQWTAEGHLRPFLHHNFGT